MARRRWVDCRGWRCNAGNGRAFGTVVWRSCSRNGGRGVGWSRVVVEVDDADGRAFGAVVCRERRSLQGVRVRV
eukprot:1946435-Prorocentrum_lima.AAC.1